MVWFEGHEEPDEQMAQQWQDRIAQQRLDLSASVEDALGDSSLPPEVIEWVEETTNAANTANAAAISKRVPLISPLLTLQSRPMPAVKPQSVAGLLSPPMVADREQAARPTRTVESGNIIARVAHRISASFTSFERIPRNDGATTSSSLPLAPPAMSEHQQGRTGKVPVARLVEAAHHTPGKQGWTKRTTKVRLQVVPKLDTMQKETISPFWDKETNPHVPTVQVTEGRIETAALTATVANRAALCGSAIFEIGQTEIAISHTSITTASVVLVMLASDPGPVVVQYVSLQPKIGFTVHLSAPTRHATIFTYVIISAELV